MKKIDIEATLNTLLRLNAKQIKTKTEGALRTVHPRWSFSRK